MKKLRIFSIMLLMISTAAFIVFQIYLRVVQDTTPPVVKCESEELVVTAGASEEELLRGVSAKDERSGDVTETIVIEKMSAFTEDGTCIITYAAVDESKNVGRCERTLVYEGYEEPRFNLNAPLTFPLGSNLVIGDYITASSVVDGDLSSNIKYTLESVVNSQEAGTYPIEFRVMDSGGKNVYLLTEIEIYGREYTGIDVQLKEYLTYIEKGTAFDANAYFQGTNAGGDVAVNIKSSVNVNEEGVYHVDYVVSKGGLKGKSRLIVVVQ